MVLSCEIDYGKYIVNAPGIIHWESLFRIFHN